MARSCVLCLAVCYLPYGGAVADAVRASDCLRHSARHSESGIAHDNRSGAAIRRRRGLPLRDCRGSATATATAQVSVFNTSPALPSSFRLLLIEARAMYVPAAPAPCLAQPQRQKDTPQVTRRTCTAWCMCCGSGLILALGALVACALYSNPAARVASIEQLFRHNRSPSGPPQSPSELPSRTRRIPATGPRPGTPPRRPTSRQHATRDGPDFNLLASWKPLEADSPPDVAAAQACIREYAHSLHTPRLSPHPVLIGGIGDSGTRAIRQMAMDFGVKILDGALQVWEYSRDSRLYAERFPVRFRDNTTRHVDHQEVERMFLGEYRDWTPEALAAALRGSSAPAQTSEAWFVGLQFAAQVLARHGREVSHQNRHPPMPLLPWGFKHPRTIFLLPLFANVTRNQVRFVHVLRDARDFALLQHNTAVYRHVCDLVMPATQCADRDGAQQLRNRLEFWSKVNLRAQTLGVALLERNYVPFRTEDAVMGLQPCIWRLGVGVRGGGARSPTAAL